ncbi:MAG: sialidase family protein [Acidimicrobiales bacterium]
MRARTSPRTMIAGLAAAGALASVIGGVAPPAGSQEASGRAPLVLPAIQLTKDNSPTRIHNQPHVLVDPTDDRRLVVVETDASSGQCFVHVSLDRGRTWAVRESHPTPPRYQSCFRPSYGPYLDARFGIDGTLFVSSAASDLGPPFQPYVARSADLGETWQFTMLANAEEKDWKLYDGTTVKAVENYQATTMTVSPVDENVVIAGFAYFGRGNSYNNAPPRGSIFISTDKGRTFGPRIDPFESGFAADKGGIDYPYIVIDRHRTTYVFSKERPPGSTAQPPPGHKMHLAKSTDGGKTWTSNVIDESPCAFCITPPTATIDPETGALYVVFERTEVVEGTDRNIFFIRSTDGGKTWSERVKLNDDPQQGRQFGANQYHPGISVAPNGRVTVAWHDFRNDILFNSETKGVRFSNPDETYWDVYATYSTDAGRTWAPNVRVSDRSMNRKAGFTTNDQVLFGPMSVASTDKTAYISWADSRSGTPDKPVEDAYFTSLVFEEPAAGSSTPALAWALVGAASALAAAGIVLILALGRSRRAARVGGPPAVTEPVREPAG